MCQLCFRPFQVGLRRNTYVSRFCFCPPADYNNKSSEHKLSSSSHSLICRIGRAETNQRAASVHSRSVWCTAVTAVAASLVALTPAPIFQREQRPQLSMVLTPEFVHFMRVWLRSSSPKQVRQYGKYQHFPFALFSRPPSCLLLIYILLPSFKN